MQLPDARGYAGAMRVERLFVQSRPAVLGFFASKLSNTLKRLTEFVTMSEAWGAEDSDQLATAQVAVEIIEFICTPPFVRHCYLARHRYRWRETFLTTATFPDNSYFCSACLASRVSSTNSHSPGVGNRSGRYASSRMCLSRPKSFQLEIFRGPSRGGPTRSPRWFPFAS